MFDAVSFAVNTGERIGVVGRNGHGKSTLFRLLTGEEEKDGGEIHLPADYRIGYLAQRLSFSKKTVLEEAAKDLPHIDDGWQELHRAESILTGLGFAEQDFSAAPQSLSGGYQVRLNLASLLVAEPNLLLLDEPTNYLDIVALRWLERFMQSWKGELMIITHDQSFMDQVTTHTLGIHRSNVRKVEGGTEKYYAQLALEEEVHEKSRLNQEKKIRETEDFIRRFR
ncbi:MAG: ABC-F family ATP-binding cassette domain-containing protein, partial [Bdellovibrionales bacterium]|nr:ABC-F family ATP-binding cassette domain-containing protein [Bdellovibrionales bacterium]